jgi:hypothetical protein
MPVHVCFFLPGRSYNSLVSLSICLGFKSRSRIEPSSTLLILIEQAILKSLSYFSALASLFVFLYSYHGPSPYRWNVISLIAMPGARRRLSRMADINENFGLRWMGWPVGT